MIGNKKGAEEMTAILWVILGIAVVIVIGIFIYSSFNKVSTFMDAQGVENKARIASCQTSFMSSFSGSTDADKFAKYCGNFEYPAVVGDQKGYVNCEFLKRMNVVSFTEDEVSSDVTAKCNLTVSNMLAYNKCMEFNNTKKNDNSNWAYYINGIECSRKLALNASVLQDNFDLKDSPLETGRTTYLVDFAKL